jgi:hypothetical protein
MKKAKYIALALGRQVSITKYRKQTGSHMFMTFQDADL